MNRTKKVYVLLAVLVVMSLVTFFATHVEKKKEDIKESGETVLEIPTDSVTSLSWNTEDNQSFAFHKDDKKWIYDEDEAFPVDKKKIEKVLKPFEKAQADFIIEDVEDFEQYGLKDPTCVIDVKTKDKDYKIEAGDFSEMDSERYVSIGDGNVYLMKTDPMETFDVALKDFIKNDKIPEFDEVEEIRFGDLEKCKIVCEENDGSSYRKDDKYFEHRDDKKIPMDPKAVEDYLDELENLNLNQYVTYNATDEEITQYGLENPQLKITVEYVKDEEKKTSVISLGQNSEAKDDEGEKGYLRLDDSRIIYEIRGDEYDSLIEKSGENLRYKTAIPFDFEDIDTIEVSMDGKTYAIKVDGDKDDVNFLYKDEVIEDVTFGENFKSLKVSEFTEEQPMDEKELSIVVTSKDESLPQVEINIYRYDGENCIVCVDNEPLGYLMRTKMISLKEAVNSVVLGGND